MEKCSDRMKELLKNLVKLSHYDPEKELCLFTDASDTHWSIILTQVPKGSLCTSKLEVHDLPHEPLAFISGAFHSSQLK